MSAAILELSHLRVAYRSRGGVVHAVQDATLRVEQGASVGLVGESGAGKSTLARAILGLLPERAARIDGGSLRIGGQDVTAFTARQWVALRGQPVAIVFQDPLSFLNPVMRVGRQIGESVRIHDPDAPVSDRVAELLALVRLPPFAAQAYPHELSGGMRQRVLLAIALGCRPELLVADEPTTALDVTTQAEILALLREIRARLGMALLLISHDLAVVAAMCERVVVMYGGCTVESGPATEVFARPSHPYTEALLHAARIDRTEGQRFATIEGDGPLPSSVLAGCPFASRCPRAVTRCLTEMPPLTGGDHDVRCWCPA